MVFYKKKDKSENASSTMAAFLGHPLKPPPIGLGLAALGRPGYINLDRAVDLGDESKLYIFGFGFNLDDTDRSCRTPVISPRTMRLHDGDGMERKRVVPTLTLLLTCSPFSSPYKLINLNMPACIPMLLHFLI